MISRRVGKLLILSRIHGKYMNGFPSHIVVLYYIIITCNNNHMTLVRVL